MYFIVVDLYGHIEILILDRVPELTLTTRSWVVKGFDILITILIPVAGVSTAGILLTTPLREWHCIGDCTPTRN